MIFHHYIIGSDKMQSLHFTIPYVMVSNGDEIMKNKIRGSFALLFATLLWGTAFVAQSQGMEHIGPFTFQAIRCLMAPVALFPIIALMEHREISSFLTKWKNRKLWKSGILCGIALFFATNLQQMGMVYTDAGKAGFITAMYIVLVPVFSIFLGRKPGLRLIISILLAVVGMYLLCGSTVTSINIGDFLILLCAIAFAIHILLVDSICQDVDGLRLNSIQALVVGLLSAVFMLFTETPKLEAIQNCTLSLLHAGVLSMGVAYSLQIIGQKHVESATASLIMSMESVVAVIAGWLILGERLTMTEGMGCLLIFLAVILSQLPKPRSKRENCC